MNPSNLPKSENPLQDPTQEQCDPETPKSFSHEKNSLSDFAKAIIRECAEQPRNSVYKTYETVLIGCPKSGYTIEQVGKYLRYVRKAIVRKNILKTPLAPPTTNLPYVPTYLPQNPPTHKQKTSFNVESEESIGVVF
jgi:hypothetical protein